jgi:transposase-like protein
VNHNRLMDVQLKAEAARRVLQDGHKTSQIALRLTIEALLMLVSYLKDREG